MIVYKIGDELFLQDEINPNSEPYLVYDGSYGSPDNFYLRSGYVNEEREDEEEEDDDGEEIFYLTIIKSGMILVNIGSLDKVREAIWYSYNTNRGDDPIGYIVNTEYRDENEYPTIRFLYSDLSFIVVEFFEDNPNAIDQDGILTSIYTDRKSRGRSGQKAIENGTIKLPLITLYNYEDNRQLIVKGFNGKYYYASIEYNGSPRVVLNNLDGIPANVIEMNGNAYLFEDNKAIIDGVTFKNVVKINSLPVIVLKTDGRLEFITINRNKSLSVNLTIENVDNFYISGEGVICIVKDDQLLSDLLVSSTLARTEDKWRVLLESGASELKFPTESYYDYRIIPVFKRVKSSLKK